MKKMMSMIKAKKARFATAVLAAAMTMSMAAPMVASAHTVNDQISVSNSSSQMIDTEALDLYEKRHSDMFRLAESKKTITVTNNGMYHAKNIALYDKRITAIGDHGEYYLSDWEVIDEGENLMGIGVGKQTYTIRGDYVVFAFSFDVALGTDYPFSGVFWMTDIAQNGRISILPLG